MTDKMMSGAVYLIDGEEAGGVIATGQILQISLPGVGSPQQDNVSFYWDATNNQGQQVSNGVYYIKVEEKDPYGHVKTITREITALQTGNFTELKVFNSAGELVRLIRDYTGQWSGERLIIDVPDVIQMKNIDDSGINVRYGEKEGLSIFWDGKNSAGRRVTSGSYEIQITVNYNGLFYNSAKTVVLLDEQEKIIESIAVSPNPFRGDTGSVRFTWQLENTALLTESGKTGRVKIRVYNIAGENVQILEAPLEKGFALWEIGGIRRGYKTASGIYIYVIEAVNNRGHFDRETGKMAIMMTGRK